MQKGKAESPRQIPVQHPPSVTRKWLDRLWLLLLVAFLVTTLVNFRPGDSCAYLATDFRGYYSSAQITLDYGFSRVYNQELQNATQEALSIRCPYRAPTPPLLHVSMPYLPVFVLLFLPLTALGFTTSYLLFSILNLVILVFYLVRFSIAFGLRPSPFRLLEWMVCLPLLSTLALGQINVFLVVCLGEFILSYVSGRQVRSGLWVAGMLIKPYILILLLTGLAVSRRWRVLYGFGAGLLIVLGSSFTMAGVDGVAASLELALRFAGPMIQTGSTMMNWRSLALNLETILPGWTNWVTAGMGMIVVTAITLLRWLRPNQETGNNFLLLILATLSATFALSWHSHFYLMVLLIPILLILDQQEQLPTSILAAWAFGPPGLYMSVFLVQQDMARNMLGLGYLGLNLFLLAWAVRQ
jgi:hypothetical protein